MIPFDPQPAPGDVPARLPSPFAGGEPHPLARRAADLLVQRLPADTRREGKMFGVLVVRSPDGTVGWLAAFSGMLDGRWHVDGFAPPVFDVAARDAFWPAGEAELGVMQARLDALAAAPARARLAAIDAAHATELAALRAAHKDRKAVRALGRAATGDAAALHAFDQQSRADTAEARRLDAAHREARASLAAEVALLDAEASTLAAARAARSRVLLHAIHATYQLTNARGEARGVRALFAPDEPPGGAGDCAGPKLIAEAYRRGLVPVALAELWWGAPPPDGSRKGGTFYPSCRGKCGVVLPFLLDGLAVDDAPRPGAAPAVPDDAPHAVFEDGWLVVVDKPVGLLSVPGRHASLRDSVQVRLRARYPAATGPLVVHRLDLDTSGLLLAALDEPTYAALQRQFARREIDKRYVAWLDGDVAGDAGAIELPLRVDLDDRPRQIVDPVHGKHAVTTWRVLAREPGRTRVALTPHTGRTHQLRVHCAVGLGAPITGDRLYGTAGPRLLLHAESLAFTHPHTGARVELSSPAPF